MAKNETKRLAPNVIVEDTDSLSALEVINGYAPHNPELAIAVGQTLLNEMKLAKTSEVQAEAAFKAAKDLVIAKEWQFHNYILDVKDQVRAQYGKDSDELQSIGLKKKVDYNTPKSSILRNKASE